MINKTESQIMKKWQPNAEPLVSIKVLTYNHKDYIEKALDGILMQDTDFPFVILIHDDASTDGTDIIIKQYKNKYPRIVEAVIEKENQYSKHDGSFRRIINSFSKYKYVAYCEGDDFWTDRNKLQRQISFMEKHPQYSMTYHAVNYVKGNSIIGNDRICSRERDISAEEIIEGGGSFIATGSICSVRKYDIQYPRYVQIAPIGDYPLQIKLSTKGLVHYFPQIMGAYRVMSQGSWSEKNRDLDIKIRNLKSNFRWLNEFNRETNYIYNQSVAKSKINYRLSLYRISNYDSFFSLFFDIYKLENNKSRYVKELIKIKMSKTFPKLYILYKQIRKKHYK